MTGSVLDDLAQRIEGCSDRVLLVSPYMSADVGTLCAKLITRRRAAASPPEARILTAIRPGALADDSLSAQALLALIDAGAAVRSIQNLHAKIYIVDQWAMLGSGNLSPGGLDHMNVEAFAVATGADVEPVTTCCEKWWRRAGDVDAGAGEDRFDHAVLF